MTPTVTSNPKPLLPTVKAPAGTPEPLAKAAFINKPKPAKLSRAPKNLSDTTAEYLKMLVYSGTGCGKTLTVAHLLEAGLTVLVLSADIGGNGLTTVSQWLKERGHADLLNNCYYFELQSYDDAEELIFNPTSVWPEIYDHDIDCVVFDGYSSFQQCLITEKVLSMSALGKNAGEARDAGLVAEQVDWGAIRTATVKNLDRFLRMYNEKTGKPWSKIVTCLESDKAKDSAGETKIGPLVQGAAAKLMEPSFDIIWRARKKKVDAGDGKKTMQYFYEMEGSSDRIITKSRGLKFNITEPGDFGALWASACKQKGIPAGKRT